VTLEAAKPQVIEVDALRPEPARIAIAAAALLRKELVAFPTETVYGLGANALDEAHVSKIFVAKGRRSDNPLIVHVPSLDAVRELVTEIPDAARVLAKQFWPGPLTMVFAKAACVPSITTGGGDTVAIRIPAHPVALALLRKSLVPLAAPSANRSKHVSPTSAAHVMRSLGAKVDVILDGGSCNFGIESTVVDVTGKVPLILRPGSLTPKHFEAVLGFPVGFKSHVDGEARRSPGTESLHYATIMPLDLADAANIGFEVRRSFEARMRDASEPPCIGVVLCAMREDDPVLRGLPGPIRSRLVVCALGDNPEAYARQLYRTLHELEEQSAACIWVEAPPSTSDWHAIAERLSRARHS
jgi:L-threonylcarbamoyladenylate synthase